MDDVLKLPTNIVLPPPPPPLVVTTTIGVKEIYVSPLEIGYGFGITIPKTVPDDLKVFGQYSGKSIVVVYSKQVLDMLRKLLGDSEEASKEKYINMVEGVRGKLKNGGGKDYQAKYVDNAVLVSVNGSDMSFKNTKILAGDRLILAEPILPEPMKIIMLIPIETLQKLLPK